ncbi:hypothetical protein E0L20_15525 [Enterobacter wuhouensis]|uniref:Uncharacterized protein n=1 Tax=Enterobacter wuhouensis TaxID=2529381 RepID=A0A4R0G4A9_9ENTR|nr:hypothetical protein E0L20_15525 [Enterobacter wuhouensis]
MQNGYCRFISYYLQKNTHRGRHMVNQVISITIHIAETGKAIVTAQLITGVTIPCPLLRLFLNGSLMFLIPV